MYVLDGTLVITNKFDKIEVFKTEGDFCYQMIDLVL